MLLYYRHYLEKKSCSFLKGNKFMHYLEQENISRNYNTSVIKYIEPHRRMIKQVEVIHSAQFVLCSVLNLILQRERSQRGKAYKQRQDLEADARLKPLNSPLDQFMCQKSMCLDGICLFLVERPLQDWDVWGSAFNLPEGQRKQQPPESYHCICPCSSHKALREDFLLTFYANRNLVPWEPVILFQQDRQFRFPFWPPCQRAQKNTPVA